MTCSRARGLTLIEVVAAIAILGTLLVGVVLAKSRLTRQSGAAQDTMQAVRLSDSLLANWWSQPEGVPVGSAGVLSESDALRWQTRVIDNAGIAEFGARVVRYEVFQDQKKLSRGDEDLGPLLVIDLVVPDPEVETREEEALQKEQEDARRNEGGGASDA
ncbi:MAG: type II secretion system GspH family protein [Phycisphaeraceae bacterium]|nr:type II secretion system GspH family protein [Phycisphaeraceae bacterium]